MQFQSFQNWKRGGFVVFAVMNGKQQYKIVLILENALFVQKKVVPYIDANLFYSIQQMVFL